MQELETDCDKGEEGSEEFAGEFHAWVFSRHRGLGHVEGFFAEEVGPQAGAGGDHFKETGDDGDDEIPRWQLSKRNHHETDRDDQVEDEPEGRIDGRVVERGLAVDGGVDVVTLEPSKGSIEGGEQGVNSQEFTVEIRDRFHEISFFGGL